MLAQRSEKRTFRNFSELNKLTTLSSTCLILRRVPTDASIKSKSQRMEAKLTIRSGGMPALPKTFSNATCAVNLYHLLVVVGLPHLKRHRDSKECQVIQK